MRLMISASDNVEDMRGASGGWRIGLGCTLDRHRRRHHCADRFAIFLDSIPVHLARHAGRRNQCAAIPGVAGPLPPKPTDEQGRIRRRSPLCVDRGCVGKLSRKPGAHLSDAEAGAVHRRDADRVRQGQRRDGAVLLPARPEGLHRPAFYERAARRFGAPGDFAQAYVIAHEVGHHVQNCSASPTRCARRSSASRQRRANALSVRHGAAGRLLRRRVGQPRRPERSSSCEPGDIEEALNAASADRRRHAAAPAPGPRGAGLVHARHLGAARALVPARLRNRRRPGGCARPP